MDKLDNLGGGSLDPSIISLIGMAVTAILAYIGASRGVTAKLSALDAKVEQLSLRVEKHNSVMERTAALEERVRWMESEVMRRVDK